MMKRSEIEAIALEVDDVAMLLKAYGFDEIAADLDAAKQKIIEIPCWDQPVTVAYSHSLHC